MLAASIDGRLYDRPGEQGGYVVGGIGVARFSPRFGGDAGVKAQLRMAIGAALSSSPRAAFLELRAAHTLHPRPYARWALGLLVGWRFGL